MSLTTHAHDRNKRWLFFLAAAGLMMLIPLVTMPFSGRMQWSAFDFALIGVFFVVVAFALEVALKVFRRSTHKLEIAAIVGVAAAILWVELAVGLVGSPLAGS